MSVDERLRTELRAVHQVPVMDTGTALVQVRRRAARQTRHRLLGAAAATVAVVAVVVATAAGLWEGPLGAAPAPAAPAPQELSEQDLMGDWVTPLVGTDTLVSSARRGEDVAPDEEALRRVLGGDVPEHELALRRVPGGDVPQRELALSIRYGSWYLAQRYVGGDWELVDHQEIVSVEGDRVTLRPLGEAGSTVLRVLVSAGPAGATLSLGFVSTSEPDHEGASAEGILRALYTTFPFVTAPK